jgi:hypothetical protein
LVCIKYKQKIPNTYKKKGTKQKKFNTAILKTDKNEKRRYNDKIKGKIEVT